MKQDRIVGLYGLQNKVAIVTGAAQGIGAATAKLFADAGAKVAVADLKRDALEPTVAAIRASGGEAEPFATDVSNEKDVKALIAGTMKRFGRIDALANVAGIFPYTDLLEMPIETWDRIQAVNARGSYMCLREAAKEMRKTGGGRIVNVASMNAFHPLLYGNSAYGVSKAGVCALTRAAAMELVGDNILVNAVAPGGIETEGGVKHATEAPIKGPCADPARMPRGLGKPEDIAAAILFLSSDAARYISGHVIVVDGGWLVL